MSKPEISSNDQIAVILDKLRFMERRVRVLESEIGIMSVPKDGREQANEEPEMAGNLQSGQVLESGFGEYGLAWIGNIVLLFGITFIIQYLQNRGLSLVSILVGYFIVAGLLILSHYLKKSYSLLARTFNYTALVLMFYVTLRLHFFVSEPLIMNKTIALVALMTVVVVQLLMAINRRSTIISGMAFIMMLCTALLSDSTHTILFLITLLAIIGTALYFRFGWWKLLLLSIFLVYGGFILWFIGNPLMRYEAIFISSHQYGFIYLFVTGAVYSLVALRNKRIQLAESISLSGVFVNGLLFTLMLVLFVLTFFKSDYIALFFLITIYCLAFSIILKSRSVWKYAPAFYALYGFLALSIAVYGLYGFPRVYWLLSLQSLLVVSLALWFRNKIIVLMNAILFVLLYCIYLGSSAYINEVNFSFAFVALASARILNWKKDRLEIKTELLRNIYLISAFIMVLFAFYHFLPVSFITLSWTVVAIGYFGLSILLKNVKYRYMALGTMMATALHLFIVDMARIEIVYRVIAFLFLAMISIFISVYYTRRGKKDQMKETEK